MKIGVISPYPISRKALCFLLESIPGITMVLEVEDVLRDLKQIQEWKPSVLLLDSFSPSADLEVLARLRQVLPESRVLLLSSTLDDEFELRVVKAGGNGCISRQAEPQLLAKALAAVEHGEIWLSHRMSSRLISEFVGTRSEEQNLTHREWEILALVAQGYRNKEIGRYLFVSESTVKTHLYAVYKKLQVTNRLEAILYYYHQTRQARALQQPGSEPASATPKPEDQFLPA